MLILHITHLSVLIVTEARDDNKESATENGNNSEHRVTDSLHLPCESGAAEGNLGVVSVVVAIVQLKTVLIHLHFGFWSCNFCDLFSYFVLYKFKIQFSCLFDKLLLCFPSNHFSVVQLQ